MPRTYIFTITLSMTLGTLLYRNLFSFSIVEAIIALTLLIPLIVNEKHATLENVLGYKTRRRIRYILLIALGLFTLSLLNGIFGWELLYRTTGIYIPNPLE